MIDEAHANRLSLALFRPAEWMKFQVKPCKRNWNEKRITALEESRRQLELPDDKGVLRRICTEVEKLPYTFYYEFKDVMGKRSKMMIEDWEIGALYRNCLRRSNNNEDEAKKKVRQKYWSDFARCPRMDTILILGTTLQYHNKRASNPFVIVGVIPLPKTAQEIGTSL